MKKEKSADEEYHDDDDDDGKVDVEDAWKNLMMKKKQRGRRRW